ncbi:MAG: hypothetical protein JXR03_06465 [Cyclobacteriaceae bacterium]
MSTDDSVMYDRYIQKMPEKNAMQKLWKGKVLINRGGHLVEQAYDDLKFGMDTSGLANDELKGNE